LDFTRILKNIEISGNWEQSLRDANDLFHFGPAKFEDAVKRYSKILELLLRYFHKEIVPTLPSRKRADVLRAETGAGKDKPFEKFTFGQEIDVFLRSGLFEHINKLCNSPILDEKRLRQINTLRTEVTHHDSTTALAEVDDARKYVTSILLRLNLINADPEKPVEIPSEAKEPDVKKRRIENLRNTVRAMRIGLIDKAYFDECFDMEKDYGWHAAGVIKGEIVGVHVAPDEAIEAIVNVLEFEHPDEDPSEVFEHLAIKVLETLTSVAPVTKDKLRILFFDAQNSLGTDMEGSACASWSSKKGLVIC
jgi:hypothetical protein